MWEVILCQYAADAVGAQPAGEPRAGAVSSELDWLWHGVFEVLCSGCAGDGHKVLCMWSMAKAFRWSIACLIQRALLTQSQASHTVSYFHMTLRLNWFLNGVVCCWGDRMGPERGKHWIFLAWLSVKVTHWGPEGDASKHLPSESLCQGSHCGQTGVGSRG